MSTAAKDSAGPIKIAIIGGGLGGLTLAIGLQQHEHLDVHVLESKAELGEVGAGVSISQMHSAPSGQSRRLWSSHCRTV